MRRYFARTGWLWPALIVLFLVLIVPLGRIGWTSLHRSTPTTGSEFVGLGNYANLLASREWWLAVATSFVVVAFVVLFQVLLGVMFAAALNRVTVAWPVMRVLVLIPLFLLSVVSVVTWREAVNGGYLAQWFDLSEGRSVTQLLAVAVSETWRGTAMVTAVVALALSRVSPSLTTATIADGATGLQRWRRVVLPSIGPALAGVAAFRVFDTYRVLDGPLLTREAAGEFQTASLVTWTTQFSTLELGLGAAMSIIVLLAAAVLAALVIPLFRVRRLL